MYRNLEKNQTIVVWGQIDSNMRIKVEEIEIVKFKMREYRFY